MKMEQLEKTSIVLSKQCNKRGQWKAASKRYYLSHQEEILAKKRLYRWRKSLIPEWVEKERLRHKTNRIREKETNYRQKRADWLEEKTGYRKPTFYPGYKLVKALETATVVEIFSVPATKTS